MANYKLCVMGDTYTGKTTLCIKLQDKNKQIPFTETTIGVAYHAIRKYIDGKEYMLHLWDTAGQERYQALLPLYYRNCHICVFVFDVTNIKTYEFVKKKLKIKNNITVEN